MKGSTTYLNWFRRLLVLGAVVAAGVITASAGAAGRPPDVQDAATAAQSSDVGAPPDVADYATALHQTQYGLTADGLRWEGIARTYQQLESGQGPTALGLKADGLRLQGEAQVYQQLQDTPDVFERYASAHPYGNGLSVSTGSIVSRPPDVSDAAQSVQSGSFDETFVVRPPDVADTALSVGNESPGVSGDGFAWSDWGIGIGMGAGFALILGAGLIIGRQLKHRGVQTA
jgi:hypothetical protein